MKKLFIFKCDNCGNNISFEINTKICKICDCEIDMTIICNHCKKLIERKFTIS